VLAWRVSENLEAGNTAALLLEGTRRVTPVDTSPTLFADAGTDNVKAQIDGLLGSGALRRVLAITGIGFSNSRIESCGGRSSTSGSSSTRWTASRRFGGLSPFYV
jgi:hypothetical protein